MEGSPWLKKGCIIAPCWFRYVVMDQEPKYAVFLCRGKGEVKVRTGERLKAGDLPKQSTESGFNCFSHYAERNYLDAVKNGYSKIMSPTTIHPLFSEP